MTLSNQSTEIALSSLKSLAEIQSLSESKLQERAEPEDLPSKASLETRGNDSAGKIVTLSGFAIRKDRFSGQKAAIATKKFSRAQAQQSANPVMTLDFFEGSGVGSNQQQDSPHTRQLKEFVFI